MTIYFLIPSILLVCSSLFGKLYFSHNIDEELKSCDLVVAFDKYFEHLPYFVSKGKLLGSGRFKEVYETSVRHSSYTTALIQPHPKSTYKIKHDLKRELLIQAFLAQQKFVTDDSVSFLNGLKQPKYKLTPQVFFITFSKSDSEGYLFNFAIVERMKTTLVKLATSTRQPLLNILKYCLEFTDLLADLHDIGLSHGDFHIKNIAIDRFGKLRLLDLGTSGPGKSEQRTIKDIPKNSGRNENNTMYFAPEVRKSTSQHPLFKGWMARTSFLSDIYSCAYAICEMIIGPYLFKEISETNNDKLQDNFMCFVFNDGESVEQKLKKRLSQNSLLISLLTKAFSTNSNERPSIREIRNEIHKEILKSDTRSQKNRFVI